MAVSANRPGNGDPPSDENLEEIEIAEEELIDAYVRGELSLEERKLIEKGLRSSPQLRERLHFARLLADAADRTSAPEVSSYRLHDQRPTPRKSWWAFWLTFGPRPASQMALAAAALMVVIGGVGLLAGGIGLRRQSQQLTAERAALEQQKLELQKSVAEQRVAINQITTQLREAEQKRESDEQRIAELTQALEQKSSVSSVATLATFFLPPISRSGPEQEFRPDPRASKIRLRLVVDSVDYVGFLAQVKNSQNQEVFKSPLRRPRSGKLVTITISSKKLPSGLYTVQLSGTTPEGQTEPVHNYTFRIASRTSNK